MNKLKSEDEYLVLDNLNLIHYVLSNRFHKNGSDLLYDDYYQQGCVGLIKAAINYDSALGYEFSTYAISIIEGEIRNYINRYLIGDQIRVPKELVKKRPQLYRLRADNNLSDNQIMEELGITYDDYLLLLGASQRSLDSLTQKEEGIRLHEVVRDPNDSYGKIEYDILLEQCMEKMSYHNKRDEALYTEYINTYLRTGEALSVKELARRFNINTANASRIKCQYDRQLKDRLMGEKNESRDIS